MADKSKSGQHETEIDIPSLRVPSPPNLEVVKDERVDAALGIFSDLKALEVTPTDQIGAQEIPNPPAVRKPKNNEFVRVHPEPQYSLTTWVFEDKDENETYMVAPGIRPLVIAGMVVKMLTLAVNQLGLIFIWPVPVDDEQSRKNMWNESSRQGYHRAKTTWIKLVGDRSKGHYRLYQAEGQLPEPRWPSEPFEQLLALGFRGRVIDRQDHPLLKAQRGLTV
jgi:hypothetical protein